MHLNKQAKSEPSISHSRLHHSIFFCTIQVPVIQISHSMTAPTQRLSSLTINCGGREPINIISTGDEHFLRSATSSSPSPLEMSGKARRLSKTWSRQDDDLLVDNRNRGLNWKQIKEHFPNKTANACRKHCERVIKDRKRSEDWDSAKIERLARRYCEQRREIWEGLAEPEDDWEIAEFKVSGAERRRSRWPICRSRRQRLTMAAVLEREGIEVYHLTRSTHD